MNEPEVIREMLERGKNIAVIGQSDSPMRASYGVSQYMQQQGYRIIPVNPTITTALSQKSYARLQDVPDKIDIADVFRRSDAVSEIVAEVVRLKIPYLWLQEGVIDAAAAKRAEDAGVKVVMDRCLLKEHMRLFR